jgi:flagellar biosynthesis chaperone FliJ
LLRLRELEEESSRLQLESAVGNRNRIERELELLVERQAGGRKNFVAGVEGRDGLSRVAGLMEIEQARRSLVYMVPKLKEADLEVAREREEFLRRRTGRRQVETLVDQAHVLAEVEAGRRAQQILDDWFGRRSQGAKLGSCMDSSSANSPTAPKRDSWSSQQGVVATMAENRKSK